MAVIMKNAVVWNVMPRGSLRTDVSQERVASIIRVKRISERGLLIIASVVLSSLILVTLITEALSSSETTVLTRATRSNNPEDTILHSHRRENLKSYIITINLYSTKSLSACNFRSRWHETELAVNITYAA
jgi:hypothetical protein